MSLGDQRHDRQGLEGADGAEVDEEAGVAHEVNDGAGGLNSHEDHEELEGDQGATDHRLEVRGEPLGCNEVFRETFNE